MADAPKTKNDIDRILAEESRYKHVWLEVEDGQSITALINGDVGWLMYLREEGDSGFSTRNPEYAEAIGDIDYYLDNGQCDEYPARWAYPVATLRAALYEFLDTKRIPCCVSWHDDSLQDEPRSPTNWST